MVAAWMSSRGDSCLCPVGEAKAAVQPQLWRKYHRHSSCPRSPSTTVRPDACTVHSHPSTTYSNSRALYCLSGHCTAHWKLIEKATDSSRAHASRLHLATTSYYHHYHTSANIAWNHLRLHEPVNALECLPTSGSYLRGLPDSLAQGPRSSTLACTVLRACPSPRNDNSQRSKPSCRQTGTVALRKK